MLTLRREQADVFKASARKSYPKILQAAIESQGLAASREAHTGDLLAKDSLGHVTRMSFYPDGLPKTLTQPSGVQHHFEHDDEGRLHALTYPGNRRLVMERDRRGNVTTLSGPGGPTYKFKHDEQDRILSILYPDKTEAKYEYNPGGQLLRWTDRAKSETVIAMSTKGHIESITDPLGRKLQYVPDDDGRLQGVVFPDGTEERYGFDLMAKRGTVVRRDGSEVHTLLDGQNRIKRIEWPDGSHVEYEFGAGDTVTKAATPTGTVAVKLGDKGNAEAETTDSGTVQFKYDSEGQLTELKTPAGETIRYEYDGDGRLVKVVDWEKREIAFAYGPDGCISTISYPNKLAERHTYPAAGRLAGATVADRDGRLLSQQAYEYDACERLVAMSDKLAGQGRPAHNWARRYNYGPQDRLLTEFDALTNKPAAAYAYDGKGNMTSAGGASIAVGDLDEPASFGGAPIQYDGLGNMTRLPGSRGEIECRWAANGLLSEAVVGDRRAAYTYDPFDRRTSKSVGPVTWRYGWANHQLLWEERKEGPDAKPVRRDYLWAPGGFMPLAFREGGRTYWLQSDSRGAVIRAYDEDGNVAWAATYDAFGQANVLVDDVRQPLRLPGQYFDEETGLHYNFARYYSPHLRSYLSRDPDWHQLGTQNYAYCANNPLNCADPFGAPWFITALVGAAVGAVVGAVAGGIAAAATGKPILSGALGGAIGGAITGAAIGSGVALAGMAVAALKGTAVAGAAAVVLPVVGSVVGTGVGTFASSLVEQARTGAPFCLTCALKEAGLGMAIDAALLGLGKIPGVRQGVKALGGWLASRGKKLFGTARGGLGKSLAWGKSLFTRGRSISKAAAHSGMSKAQARQVFKVAAKHKVQIRVRPTNKDAIALRAKGHSPKPSFIKNKTITQFDVDHLGAKPDKLGMVGCFKPTKPPDALKLSNPDLYAKAMKRFEKRSEEFLKQRKLYLRKARLTKQLKNMAPDDPMRPKVQARLDKHSEKLSQYKVKDGVMIDNRPTIDGKPNKGQGKAFTGDNDIFDIKDLKGNPVSPEKRREVIKDLSKGPLNAQHSDHMSWRKDSPQTYNRKAFDDIVNDHAPGCKPEDKLGTFGPGYDFSTTNSTPIQRYKQ
ncbi:MAG: RHS repeat protein [Planctomycetes bacterium]|nr:RHS repeat protein [Planctomycetota bacterium]